MLLIYLFIVPHTGVFIKLKIQLTQEGYKGKLKFILYIKLKKKNLI